MTEIVRRMPWSKSRESPLPLITREWLVTNGLGGYASGTVAGVSTRRYHGLLISALPAPTGRVMTLTHLSERIRSPDGELVDLSGVESGEGQVSVPGADHLEEFLLIEGLPVWRYRIEHHLIEKRVFLIYRQNTAYVLYRILEGEGKVRLKVRPSLHLRSHDAPVSTPVGDGFQVMERDGRIEITQKDRDMPPLKLSMRGLSPAFTLEGKKMPELLFRIEESRGYESRGDMWSPGYFRVDLTPEQDAAMVVSTEDWEVLLALGPEEALTTELERRRRLRLSAHPAARDGMAEELVIAADCFVIRPEGRVEATARAQAAGDEVRTVIAGYHWFTDWGRDTMISLEGLTLVTGRFAEGGSILRTFAHAVKDGLIPNMFPERERDGLYHTADATLWFFHALARYEEATGDVTTLDVLLPTMKDIAVRHIEGTHFGIGVDPTDGLLRQGAEGYQLTWMDAKVGDWVVTPRRGKAVEINALFYNALRLLEGWIRDREGEEAARPWGQHADRVRESFNRRYWYEEGEYLYDVVDGEAGDDPACRPNQIFSFSLDHPVLDRERWKPVFDVVTRELLTPFGLRTLSRDHPDFKPVYTGHLRARDAAYHQGTVWAWLIGPYVDARLRVFPEDRAGARELLTGFEPHLFEACVGSISEIFDANEPWTPRGCIAQAWSVAEVLRAWVRTADREGADHGQ